MALHHGPQRCGANYGLPACLVCLPLQARAQGVKLLTSELGTAVKKLTRQEDLTKCALLLACISVTG